MPPPARVTRRGEAASRRSIAPVVSRSALRYAAPVSWPSHGPRGRHDWWTYLERGDLDPFRDVLRQTPDVVDAPVDDSERTMLMVAVERNAALVEMLIQAGADVNRRDAHGRPVWDFVPTSGPQWVAVWRLLIEAGLDVQSRAPNNVTPLVAVAAAYLDPATDRAHVESRAALVRLQLDAGADVNAMDDAHVSALQAAAAVGDGQVVALLLEAHATPNRVARGTRSALFNAAMHGHARATQALLKAGADVEATAPGSRIKSFPVFTSGYVDVEGVTPLLAAAENGHFDVVRLLVEAGADVDRADSSGFTPLMGASRAGDTAMAKFLLERGARPDAVDHSGKTAASHAAEFVLQRSRQKGE